MSAATGGLGRMSHLELLSAERYTGIGDKSQDVERVRVELQVIIDAIPTQIHPDQREAYLNAILEDLEDREGAPWTEWPEDIYLLALTAIRFLARNPVGSTTLLDPPHLLTVLHHTSLPFPAPASPFSYPSPPPYSLQAIEALKIMANLLVLHPSARDLMGKVGGMKALTLALAGKDAEGLILEVEVGAEREAERVFLLARLGFLGTVERPEVVRMMVDQGGVVQSISYYLTHLAPIQANYMAISEVLKLAMNILRYYPIAASGSQTTEQWDERFDILLAPLLVLLHTLPTTTLAPPLSTTLHTLLSVPFITRLLPTWHAIPEPPSPASSTNSVKSLIHRISNIGSSSSSKRSSVIGSRSGSFNHSNSNGDEGKETGLGLSGHHPRSHRPKSPSPPRDQTSTNVKERQIRTIPTIHDPTAFPLRVLKILDTWFEGYMPYPLNPDEVDGKVMVDEVVPPILLLMARAAEGSEEFRRVFREQLLPVDLDRSPSAGPLESRRGTLGHLLRLMQCSNHLACRDSAGEFLWAVCDSDAATLTAEIGYGNAAGFLFQRGISAPPPGKIQDLPPSAEPSTYRPPQPANPGAPRHPISSLSEPLPQSSDIPMTPKEKEREAERLFVLLDRMEKNPVISMSSDEAGEEGKEGKKGVRELMRDKLGSGVMEDWDEKDEEEERKRAEEEDKEDEEEVKREMERYKKRMGR